MLQSCNMSNLLKLKNKSQPFEIRNKTATKAEIVLYGAIGPGGWFEEGISAKSFQKELKTLEPTVNEITVRINSPGGDVFDGITIYNLLKSHSAKIIVRIDGLAASIASIIALAGDEIIMGEGALYMVHLPWTGRYGNRMDFENTINLLLDIEEQMVSIYAKKTGMGRAEIKSMLEEETWLDADDSIEKGFVDKKSDEESLPVAASAMASATWLRKVPKMKTEGDLVREEIQNIKNKLTGLQARK